MIIDQYRWVHKGVYDVQLDGCGAINEKSNGVNGKFCNPQKGNTQFRLRIQQFIYTSLTSDHSVYEHYEHKILSIKISTFCKKGIYNVPIVYYKLVFTHIKASNPLQAPKDVHRNNNYSYWLM